MSKVAAAVHSPLMAFTTAQLQQAVQIGGSLATIAIALGIGVLWVPKAVLRSRWRNAEMRAEAAETALAALAPGMAEMRADLAHVRTELAAVRIENTEVRNEIAKLRTENAEAALWGASLLLHFRRRGAKIEDAPKPPNSIREAVLNEIKLHEAADGTPSTVSAVEVAAAVLNQ